MGILALALQSGEIRHGINGGGPSRIPATGWRTQRITSSDEARPWAPVGAAGVGMYAGWHVLVTVYLVPLLRALGS